VDKAIFPTLTELDLRLPFYVSSVGYWKNQVHIVREHEFPDFQWIQCMSGKGKLCVNNQAYTIEQNEGFFLTPYVPHEYYPLSEQWEVCWVSFNGAQINETLRTFGLLTSTKVKVTYAETLLQKLKDMILAFEAKESSSSLKASELIYSFLLHLQNDCLLSERKTRHEHHAQLQPAIDYIEGSYASVVTLDAIAHSLNVTPQYTCLLFQQAFGLRPIEYVTRVRIQKAKELLIKHSQMSVSEVAALVGYENVSYFIKQFKKYENLTPTAFRKLYLSS